jgi:hypothetical protein
MERKVISKATNLEIPLNPPFQRGTLTPLKKGGRGDNPRIEQKTILFKHFLTLQVHQFTRENSPLPISSKFLLNINHLQTL